MTTNNPFGPGSPLNDLLKRQREQSELIKRALGPGYELQQRMKAHQGPFTAFKDLQRSGILSSAFAEANIHAESIKAMQGIATPAWMLALQKTAIGISRDDVGILKMQRLLAGSLDSDVLKLAGTFDANRSTVAALMRTSTWTEQFQSLSERFAPGLAAIKVAAERARMLDMTILRASAQVVAKSAVVMAAEQVLEAHRLIEAIGQAESPEQTAGLLTALVSLVAAIFSGFGENTLKELRGIGAFRLIELLLMAFAILHMVVPAELSPAEQKVVTEMKVEIATLEDKLGQIVAANEAANEAYVADLPRAELKRDAAIRRDAQGKAPMLMRGTKGTPLAVKDSRGKWRLVVYRDALTDQLSEGWVYAPAVQLLDGLVK